MAAKQRPLSPFMIGPYYRPQLTSVLSITHRITGILLAVGALVLAAWLLLVAGDAAHYQRFMALASSALGLLVLAGFSFCLIYHFLNGIRHLFWDAGRGLAIPDAYRSGWLVVVLSVLLTAAMWLYLLMVRGGAA